MTKPTIHGNGTSALSLATAYGDAYAAIQAAGVVLKETAPNARDYNGGAEFDAAAVEHRDRMRRLESVMAEKDELMGWRLEHEA